jgi:hypothetical protein
MERARKLLPTEKFLGRASNNGFFAVFVVLLAPKGAAAGFFPVPFLTGGWSLRRGHQSSVTVRTVDNAWLPGALMLDAPKCTRAQQNASMMQSMTWAKNDQPAFFCENNIRTPCSPSSSKELSFMKNQALEAPSTPRKCR